jgi:hypothetical protein
MTNLTELKTYVKNRLFSDLVKNYIEFIEFQLEDYCYNFDEDTTSTITNYAKALKLGFKKADTYEEIWTAIIEAGNCCGGVIGADEDDIADFFKKVTKYTSKFEELNS